VNDSDDSRIIVQTIVSGARRRDMDNETGNVTRCCFECELSGNSKTKRTVDYVQNQQTSSKKAQCP
ncbi:5095_t:CDS:2, partial [Gigaspora rosea]